MWKIISALFKAVPRYGSVIHVGTLAKFLSQLHGVLSPLLGTLPKMLRYIHVPKSKDQIIKENKKKNLTESHTKMPLIRIFSLI